MNVLNSAERRFGRLAIPGLIRFLAIIQLFAFVLQFIQPELRNLLNLDLAAILAGEIWRIVGFAFAPFGDPSNIFTMLFAIFGAFLLIAFGEGLEQQWGVFRTNLYVIFGWCMNLIASLGFQYFGLAEPDQLYPAVLMLDASILFAFATYYPRFTIQLFFVLPVPVFIIALISAMPIVFAAFGSLGAALFGVLAQANYLLSVVPGRIRDGRRDASNLKRRNDYRRKSAETGPTLHHCKVCDRTEADDPNLDFRVGADGEEYCEDHLPDSPGS